MLIWAPKFIQFVVLDEATEEYIPVSETLSTASTRLTDAGKFKAGSISETAWDIPALCQEGDS